MQHYLRAAFLLFFAIATAVLQAQSVLYITPNGAGTKNGSTWSNAGDSSQVQAFINTATTGAQIWVAKGTYKPNTYPTGCTNCNTTRQYSFLMKNGVALYGGFAGNEAALAQRNVQLDTTILSGDIGVKGDSTDNTLHVVTSLNTNATALLDGFTITGGYAYAPPTVNDTVGTTIIQNLYGAGLYAYSSSMAINNCTFTKNWSSADGAGAYFESSYAILNNLNFTSNYTNNNGGGLAAVKGGLRISHSNFFSNWSNNGDGGAVYFNQGGHHLYNCVLAQNYNLTGNGVGLAAVNTSGDSILATIFAQNHGSSGVGGGIYASGCTSQLVINSVFFQNNSGHGGAVGMENINSSNYLNCTFNGNSATQGCWFYNAASSSVFQSCVVWANGFNSLTYDVPGSMPTPHDNLLNDLASDPLFVSPSHPSGLDSIWGTADDGLRLSCQSPAIDSATANLVSTDIVGNARPFGRRNDLGAYESQDSTFTSSVTIVQSPNPACLGAPVTLTAVPVNGGSSPVYSWKVNGVADTVHTASRQVIATTNTVYLVNMTSSQSCINPAVATSGLAVNVTGPQPPVMSIAASPDTNLCSGQPVIFTATPYYPGTNPVFKWTQNGQPVGTNSITYSPAAYTNADVIACTLTSLACTTPVSSAALVSLHVSQANIIYVRAGATGNGTSWNNCFGNLDTALAVATPGCTQIWVAAGTYTPQRPVSYCTTCTGSRYNTFQLKNGVAVYGGFWGNETSIAQRDILNNSTVLSGETGGVSDTDNCYHVVTSALTNSTAILDGFTIQAGNANGTSGIVAPVVTGTHVIYQDRGAGIYNILSSAHFANCSILSNKASDAAGGIYNDSSQSVFDLCNVAFNYVTNGDGGGIYNNNYSNPTFNHCLIYNNTAANNGGGCENYTSSANYSACVFSRNVALNGGGCYNTLGTYQTVVYANCVFTNNTAQGTLGSGGGAYNDYGYIDYIFCTFSANSATKRGSALYCGSSSHATDIENSIISNNSVQGSVYELNSVTGGVGVSHSIVENYNVILGSTVSSSNPLFVNPTTPIGNDNTWATFDDGLMLQCNSPAIDTGLAYNSTYLTDITGTFRYGKPDIGAYEINGQLPLVSLSTLADTVCANSVATFDATVTNNSGNPVYHWQRNGVSVGRNSFFYTDSAIADNDIITCYITSGLLCGTTIFYSDTITMHTFPVAVVPTITAGGPATFCAGDSLTLTAHGSAAYTWSTGATSAAITVKNSGSYQVSISGNSGCNIGSLPLSVTVNPLPDVNIAGGALCAGQSTILSVATGGSYNWSTGATTSAITITQAGTYWVTANANGCLATSTGYTVTVTPFVTPFVTARVNHTSFCRSGAVQLSSDAQGVGGNPSYTWFQDGSPVSSGSGFATSYSVGTYNLYVQMISDLACASPDTVVSDTVSFTVHPLPVATLTISGNVLTASYGSSYEWQFNGNDMPNVTGQSFTATQAGNYDVYVTDSFGCQSNVSNTISYALGIGTISNVQIEIYPNPTSSLLHITSGNNLTGYTFSLTDLTGRVVLRMPMGTQATTVNVASLGSDVYICLVNNIDGDVVYRQRVVITR